MYTQSTSNPIQGLDRCAVILEAILDYHSQIWALLQYHFTSHGFTQSEKTLWKSRLVALASGGSEHAKLFSVAISWGNKMNFGLYVNITGLAQIATYCNYFFSFSQIISAHCLGIHEVCKLIIIYTHCSVLSP